MTHPSLPAATIVVSISVELFWLSSSVWELLDCVAGCCSEGGLTNASNFISLLSVLTIWYAYCCGLSNKINCCDNILHVFVDYVYTCVHTCMDMHTYSVYTNTTH